MTAEQSALARLRLRLGIANVGFWVLLSIGGLVWLSRPGPRELGIHPAALVFGLVAAQGAFDYLGHRWTRRDPTSSSDRTLGRWARGVAVHTIVLAAVATVGAASLRWTGGFCVGTALSMIALAWGRERLLGAINGAPVRTMVLDDGTSVASAAAGDTAFTGGILGFGGRARILLPERWRVALPAAEMAVERFRRQWQVTQGWPLRTFLMLLLWNLAGSCLGSLVFRFADRPLNLALLGHACWMTLWTFLSLLVLPVLGQGAVFAADRAALEAGLDPRDWIRRFPDLVGEDGSPHPAVQTIFYPIPSAASRVQALSAPRRWSAAGQLARNNLYYSWAVLTPLGRAVHCNVGRPALWVFPPSP